MPISTPTRLRFRDALAAVPPPGARWADIRRPPQIPPPGVWAVWYIKTGRGWGKTRTAAEWVHEQVHLHGKRHIALVSRTIADVRDTMITGETGILNTGKAWGPPPAYEPSKRHRLIWANGAEALGYSSEKPEQLRGPAHDAAWGDEVAYWENLSERGERNPWYNLQFSLRVPPDPRCVLTTTPRPLKILKEIAGRAHTVISRGTTYENLDNLAPAFREAVIAQHEGTRLGRQELLGEDIEDIEGALWTWAMIEQAQAPRPPDIDGWLRETAQRVVVAVDPAVTHGENADETAIAAAAKGKDGLLYVLACEGMRLSPHGWAQRVGALYDQYGADRVIAERNNGGEMVESTIRQVRPDLPVRPIVASRGKTVRAEPVAALYEQGKVKHLGPFRALEEQMTAFPVAAEHDDQVDALVYALTELLDRPTWTIGGRGA